MEYLLGGRQSLSPGNSSVSKRVTPLKDDSQHGRGQAGQWTDYEGTETRATFPWVEEELPLVYGGRRMDGGRRKAGRNRGGNLGV